MLFIKNWHDFSMSRSAVNACRNSRAATGRSVLNNSSGGEKL